MMQQHPKMDTSRLYSISFDKIIKISSLISLFESPSVRPEFNSDGPIM